MPKYRKCGGIMASFRIYRAVLAVFIALSATLFSIGASNAEEKSKSITLFYQEWGTSVTISNVAKLMLEKIGYKVEMKLLDTGLIYQALGSGKGELFASSYLPGQQAYLNKLGDKLDIISTSYGPVPGGIGVPAYVNASSIEDLKDPKVLAELDNKVIGIDAGAGLMRLATKAIQEYGLSIQLVPSSEAGRTAAFRSAYERKKPIAIIHYCPHILCAKYDLKFLADPKHVFGAARDVYIAREGFREQYPDAVKLLSRMTIFSDDISLMMDWMDTQKLTGEQAAQRYLDEHPEFVWYWMGDLKPGMEKPASLKSMN